MSLVFGMYASTGLGSAIQCTCVRAASGEVIVAYASGVNHMVQRRSLTSPHVQLGNAVTLTSANTAKSMAMISDDKVVIGGSSNSKIWIVNLAAETCTELSGTYNSPSSTERSQGAAGQPSSGIGFVIDNAVATIWKIDAAAETKTSVTLKYFSSTERAVCIIAKPDSTTNFLVGTNIGKIYEIDSNGNPVKGYSIQPRRAGTAAVAVLINQIAYFKGFVLAILNTGEFVLVDHEGDGRVVHRYRKQSGASSTYAIEWTMADTYDNPSILYAFNPGTVGTRGNAVIEKDFTTGAENSLILTSGQPIRQIGYVGASGYANINNTLGFFTYTQAATAALPSLISIGGTATEGEVFVVDDTTTPRYVLKAKLSTTARQIPVASGANIIRVYKKGDGQDALYQVKRTNS